MIGDLYLVLLGIVLGRLAVSRGVFLVIGYWYLVIGAFRDSSLAVGCFLGAFQVIGTWYLVLLGVVLWRFACCSAAFWVFVEIFLLSHLVGDVRIVFFR